MPGQRKPTGRTLLIAQYHRGRSGNVVIAVAVTVAAAATHAGEVGIDAVPIGIGARDPAQRAVKLQLIDALHQTRLSVLRHAVKDALGLRNRGLVDLSGVQRAVVVNPIDRAEYVAAAFLPVRKARVDHALNVAQLAEDVVVAVLDGARHVIDALARRGHTLVVLALKRLEIRRTLDIAHGRRALSGTAEQPTAAPEECARIASPGVDFLAAGIGNIHGIYPDNWKGLDFEALDRIHKATNNIPLVLHGGTGIPDEMIKKAISLGVSKINVNTECQLSFADATRKYIEAGKDLEGKGFDPRKLLAPGAEAIKATVREKIELFGSANKV